MNNSDIDLFNQYPDPVHCVFGACKCLVCGNEQGFHRAGCRCWDMFRALEDEEYAQTLKMQYGMYFKSEEDTAMFISFDDIQILLSNGRKVYDTDKSEMTLEYFKK